MKRLYIIIITLFFNAELFALTLSLDNNQTAFSINSYYSFSSSVISLKKGTADPQNLPVTVNIQNVPQDITPVWVEISSPDCDDITGRVINGATIKTNYNYLCLNFQKSSETVQLVPGVYNLSVTARSLTGRATQPLALNITELAIASSLPSNTKENAIPIDVGDTQSFQLTLTGCDGEIVSLAPTGFFTETVSVSSSQGTSQYNLTMNFSYEFNPALLSSNSVTINANMTLDSITRTSGTGGLSGIYFQMIPITVLNQDKCGVVSVEDKTYFVTQ